jgi:NAD(P)-dependent dehydrogenase (short-subunit alcohol dehydrogenase family)
MKNILIFGACGSIGNFIYESFKNEGNYNVFGTTTQKEKKNNHIFHVTNQNMEEILDLDDISVIIWCQGFNFNDNITTFNENNFTQIIEANVTFIIKTLNFLLDNNKILDNSKMVIISSIWELLSRENKLSYGISKGALNNMTKSLSYDLSKKNILINNVLPGVVDNDMTRKTLQYEQIEYIKNYMGFNRLISLDDIFKTVKFLCIENTGITGQSICVDLGFTSIRKYS